MPELNFRVGADIGPLRRAIADARREITRGLTSIGGIGGLLTGAGIAAGATKAVTDHVERAKDIARLAQLANASIQEASKLLATGQAFGVTSDKMADALRNVSQVASGQPDLFRELGIATEDASGKSRTAIDIFNDVRRAVSEGGNDYRTTTAAAKIFGRSVADIYPFLRASEEQVKATTERLQEMGVVMREDDVDAALAFAGSLKVAEMQGQALSSQIAGVLIPILGGLAEAAMTAGDMLGAMIATGTGSGWDNFWNNMRAIGLLNNIGTGPTRIDEHGNRIEDVVANKKAAAEQIQPIVDQVAAKEKIRADFARLAKLGLTGGAGGSFEFPGLGGGRGRDTVADAMRDRIDAVRDEAKEKERATRDALELYQRERETAIDTARDVADAWEKERRRNIEAVRDEAEARREASREHIEQIREQLEQRERQRARAIAAIRDEIDAERSAFDERETVRQAQRAALEEELEALDDRDRDEQRAADLQQARDELAAAQAEEPIRIRSESLDEFRERHTQWTEQLAAAERRLAEIQEQQAEEVAREAIEAKLREVDAATSADRQELDVARAAHEQRIALIEAEEERERDAAEAAIERLEKVAAETQKQFEAQLERLEAEAELEKAVSDARIEEMQRQLRAHTDRVEAEIEAKQRETEATLSELEKQLTAHQRVGAAIQAAHQNIQRTITYNVVTNGAVAIGAADSTPRMGGIREFAAGGSGVITQPTLLVNARTGQAYASVAEHGAEAFAFGGAASGGGREELHVYIDGREVQARVSRRAYRDYRMRGGPH
jgi:ABC-type transporter Mla subunit MlaD